MLQNLFRTAITRRGYKEQDLYDWEKEGNGLEDETNANTTPAQQQQQQILSNINNKVSAYVNHRQPTGVLCTRSVCF